MPNKGYNGSIREAGSAAPIPGRCGRKMRNTDPIRYCMSHPVKGRDCCMKHGGAIPTGVNHYKYRHGKYSRHMPEGLIEAYERAMDDENLTSLRDDLALIEARQVELLHQLKDSKPVPWERITKCFDRLEGDINAERDTSTSVEAMRTILSEGRNASELQDKVWEDINNQTDRKGRLATMEHKRLQDLSCTITADQAMALMHAFLAAGKEFILDPLNYKHFTARVLSMIPEAKQDPIMIEAKEVK